MAKLYLTEYGDAVAGGRISIAGEPALKNQAPLAIGSETKSAVFGDSTKLIRVHVDAICSIAIGKTPTATTNSMRLAADTTEYFGVQPGDKLSVISNS